MAGVRDENKAAWILGILVCFEAGFLASMLRPGMRHFLVYTGFLAGRHTPRPAGILAALAVAAGFTGLCARLPSVRDNLVRLSWLKLLALLLAIVAGPLEEIVFRGLLMDGLMRAGTSPFLQVLISGVAFGLLHGVWAFFRGNWRTGVGAVTATGLLGTALAVVYLLSGRSLAPCIAAHFLLDLLAEPGLVLAAIRGEMGRSASVSASVRS